MFLYEKLLEECESNDIEVYERKMKSKGLYGDNVIWINKYLPTYIDKYCILAEELGHYHKTHGDILDQSKLINRKHELVARSWAYEKIVPLSKIVQAHNNHIKNKFELSDFLGVTEAFLESALNRYKEKYGLAFKYDEYIICFEPLGVTQMFN